MMWVDSAAFPLFIIGLLGGGHCVGMCGGIVSALSLHIAGERKTWPLQIAYNIGRIASYTLAGALTGGLAYALGQLLPLQRGLYLLAQIMLISMGLYLLGVTALLAPLEAMGQKLWQKLQPYGRHFLPVRNPLQALAVGLLWGWLPCGLVYSALISALAAGNSYHGAIMMLAFGLGTLPNLLLAGLLLVRFRRIAQARWMRLISGGLIITYGIYGVISFFRA